MFGLTEGQKDVGRSVLLLGMGLLFLAQGTGGLSSGVQKALAPIIGMTTTEACGDSYMCALRTVQWLFKDVAIGFMCIIAVSKGSAILQDLLFAVLAIWYVLQHFAISVAQLHTNGAKPPAGFEATNIYLILFALAFVGKIVFQAEYVRERNAQMAALHSAQMEAAFESTIGSKSNKSKSKSKAKAKKKN